MTMKSRACLLRTALALSAVVVLFALPPGSWAGDTTAAPDADSCLGCHSNKDLELVLPSGEKRSLYVDAQNFARSVHGGKLRCTDCHSEISTYPHPPRSFKNLREFALAYHEICKTCHFDNYTKTLDSVHYAILAKGNLKAPLCVDCHGAHDVTRPGIPKSRISAICSRCHHGIYDRYSQSVHGKGGLQEGNNTDTPAIKLVIADDHALFREGVRALLSRHNDLEVVGEAADGREAIERVLALHPHILLLDIAMPGLGGLETTLEIRKSAPEVKIVILTQYANTYAAPIVGPSNRIKGMGT
jgi:predicted CXXCH cytochrome family protein